MKKFCLLLVISSILLCRLSAGALLFRNGEPQAEILIPKDANPVERYAAQELAEHLRLAGGKPVMIVTAPTGKTTLIRLGRAAAGYDKASPQENGATIVIDDATVAIEGNDDPGDPLDFKVRCGTLFGVYDFLEKELGVRWLWPGETGTIVPRRGDIELTRGRRQIDPPLEFARWRFKDKTGGWYDPANGDRMYRNTRVWLRRHRFNSRVDVSYGHAYHNYFDRYGASRPELFNLLPNGRRVSDPTYYLGQPRLISMCVSNPDLIRLTIEEWLKKGIGSIINVNENDTPGRCVCPACLALDGNPDPHRVKRAAARFARSDPNWVEELGSLTDRYAAFYLAVQREADKIDPDCRLIGCIYANYYEPPTRHKLNPRIIMRFCPPLMYPWTKEKVAEFKRLWKGWADSGVSLMLRPNFTWDGHDMPLLYYREFAECFDFAKDRGLRFADFDSLTGMFGANGLTLYVIASKLGGGRDKSLAELENDYFAAFGKAEPVMREVVKLLADATSAAKPAGDKPLEACGGNFMDFFLTADRVFPPELMSRCLGLLDEAARRAADDPTVLRRVEFVRTGLADADMVLKTQRTFREYQKTGDPAKLIRDMRELEKFRTAHEHLGYADIRTVRGMEYRRWPTQMLLLGDGMKELTNWQVRLDPDDAGVQNEWFRDASAEEWRPVSVNESVEESEVFREFNRRTDRTRVVSWYRNIFTYAAAPGSPVKITFGAIDGSADIYLNGELILKREYPLDGDKESNGKPFEIDLTGKLKAGENLLSVRVHKAPRYAGGSGIWRQVFLSCGPLAPDPAR